MDVVSHTITNLTIFVLAIYVGYHVVWTVTPALHTPLMAVTNAISAIVVVGAMLAAALTTGWFPKLLGVAAVALASVNIFGGFLVTLTTDPQMMLILIMGFLFFAGMLVDSNVIVLLLTPMFVPLASAVGMDTVQLGIMMIVNLSIGLYHPPIGTTLFITSSIAKVRIGDVVKELIPFYVVALLLLLGFAYLPWLTLH